MENRWNRTIKALEQNHMKVYPVVKKEEILPLLQTLVPKGATVGVGGSETLQETGVLQWVQSGAVDFFNRYDPTLSRTEVLDVMRASLSADYFLTSSNAILETGELYNVDGTGNRVAALCFGPKKVIVIAGANKIVPDINAAVLRVKRTAAPKNTVRLHCATPCAKTGACISLTHKQAALCDGCQSEERICVSYVVTGRQREKDRISVILCKENIGY